VAVKQRGVCPRLASFLPSDDRFGSCRITASSRSAVRGLFQPIVLVYLGRGFYAKSADATWTMSWRSGSATTLPLSFGLGYVLLREDWPPNVFVSGEWMAYRQFAPVAPQTTLRLGMTIAFPQFRPW
jgi:hypothetical protein